MRNWLYVFSVGKWRHKIGVSSTPETRLMTLQIGCPEEIEFSMHAETPFAYEIEKACHELLAPKTIKGEWFCGTLDEMGHAIEAAWLKVRGCLPGEDFVEEPVQQGEKYAWQAARTAKRAKLAAYMREYRKRVKAKVPADMKEGV